MGNPPETVTPELTKEAFKRNLNTTFWLRDHGGARVSLELVEIRNGYSTSRQEMFSLLFRGDPGRIHPQQVYPMEHDAIGTFDLFLVPVGRDHAGTSYEAIFNRLLKVRD
jgi:hypothetical protein